MSNSSGRSTSKPGATTSITWGMKISTTMVNTTRISSSTEKTWSAKTIAGDRPCASNRLEKSGTKAAANAPSATSRRNMLGKRKATMKASTTPTVPRIEPIRMSRTKPRMRLASV